MDRSQMIASDELDKMVTHYEAAKIMNVKPDTLYRRCQRETVEGAKKIGRTWLIPFRTILNISEKKTD